MNVAQRCTRKTRLIADLLALLCLPYPVWPQSFQGVLTGQFNVQRTGANLAETILAPSNVSAGTFGLLFTQTVDAAIYAQPLYLPGLTVNNAVHNVVFVATMNDSVYAFDADTAQPPLWHTSLGSPILIGTAMGILSTPVIDTNSKMIFVVTLSGPSATQSFVLHALNLLTGEETANINIQGAVAGTGDNSQSTACTAWNGTTVAPPCIPFVPAEQLQRPALLELTATATILVGFGTRSGQEAVNPYHGWLFGYQYSGGAFTQTMIFNSTLNSSQTGQPCSSQTPPTNLCGRGGGIWMSGRGPAADATGVYVVTGNGGYGGTETGNWGESALRLNGAGVVEDSFTPSTYTSLNEADLDLGDAGAILFTSSNTTASQLLLAGGKTGKVYVLNRANLGGFTSGNLGAVQTFTATSAACGTGPGQSGCYEIHSMAYWPRTNTTPIFYIWAWGDSLRVWDFNASTNQFRLDANQGKVTSPNYPGGGLAISANGNANGILWAIIPAAVVSSGQTGVLYAFNATNVSTPLWMSTDYWFATKFTIPTIANGKVYVPTAASPSSVTPAYAPQLRVYGLCTNCPQERANGGRE